MDQTKNNKRILSGVVVSDKMSKTVVVAVTRLRMHSIYKKQYKRTSRFKAHDERGEFHIGDKVMIRETRPLSKEKRWEVITKSEQTKAQNV